MSTAILMCVLFFAKVVDNALSTTKTILVQRNHSILKHLGEKNGVTLRIYTRQVSPSEEKKIIHMTSGMTFRTRSMVTTNSSLAPGSRSLSRKSSEILKTWLSEKLRTFVLVFILSRTMPWTMNQKLSFLTNQISLHLGENSERTLPMNQRAQYMIRREIIRKRKRFCLAMMLP